jgi:serine/threonine protein kinase
LKVADFGLAKQFSYAASNFNYKSGRGAMLYMAPERLDELNYSFPSDIWYFYLLQYFYLNLVKFLKVTWNNII